RFKSQTSSSPDERSDIRVRAIGLVPDIAPLIRATLAVHLTRSSAAYSSMLPWLGRMDRRARHVAALGCAARGFSRCAGSLLVGLRRDHGGGFENCTISGVR